MRRFSSAASAIGSVALVVIPVVAMAQNAPRSVVQTASLSTGAVRGAVHDEGGTPVAGAMVSALGAITAFAVTGADGRFELSALPPGPYLVRAHVRGFNAPRGQLLEVRAGTPVFSSIALRKIPTAGDTRTVLSAGLGAPAADTPRAPAALVAATPQSDATATDGDDAGTKAQPDDDELTWRLRHLRRSILKDGAVAVAVVSEPAVDGNTSLFGRAVSSPVRMASDFFTPFSGQLNLLTTSSFDDPAQLFEGDNQARGITYVALGAPFGTGGDWTVRGALTQGDLTSWIVAGSYETRAEASGRHRYDVRLSYSTQRYDGGNPEALRAVTDGSRNVGMVSGFDTFEVSHALSVTYGGRYSHYDYLDGRTLLSPRVGITLSPWNRLRVTALVSRRALAPGAEEFVPPSDNAVWLPPQRTFSSAVPGGRLTAEHATHFDVGVERDIAFGTVTAAAFHQHVDDQLVTLFGAELPDRPAEALGHYFVGGAGNVDVSGWTAGFRTAVADRLHGAVEYSASRTGWVPGPQVDYLVLLAPSVARRGGDRIHDLSTRLEADVPETDTRVVVLYRVSDGFSRGDNEEPALDSRFDVQVHQSLPFLDFTSAKWEMLVAVRNFFRDPTAGQSVYDELLVVRPPKRIVGGLTLRF